jgi:hypothetical protein
MQDNRSSDATPQGLDGLLDRPDNGLSANTLQGATTIEQSSRPTAAVAEVTTLQQKLQLGTKIRLIISVSIAVILLVGGAFVFLQRTGRVAQLEAGSFGPVSLPLGRFANAGSLTESAQTLKVNGRLDVTSSIVLSPSAPPENPVAGQFYFDQTSNLLRYYNGQQFINIGGGGGDTNITNNLIGGSSGASGTTDVLLQASSPGTLQTGNFSISGTGTVGELTVDGGDVNLSNGSSVRFGGRQALSSNSSGTTTALSNTSSAGTVAMQSANFAVQDASGANTLISVDTSLGGDVTIATRTTTGVSGDISIKTGDSTTTASGNITIDAGSGIIDGEVITDKTFESSLENYVNWFGSSVSQTTAQAHSGTHSLAMTATDAFWGVQENVNNPITHVVSGHQYHFSIWVRAATTTRAINAKVVWVGSGTAPISLQVINDSASAWTEITGNGVAPAGATGVYLTMQSTGVIGEVHYFDDITVTDLSSSSAAAIINIGNTNAKIINIGNLNQIGATSIVGGSGISLSSGVSGISLNGGAITVNAGATSNFSTTSGALTLTSAAAATWGISAASTGVGGTLTLRAGGGGTDNNNDGGDLLLQGGAKNGTGTAGSVIVRPPTDIVDAFMIQNSASTPLFTADSSGMQIIVSGTDTTFATLTLSNAHFKSTQTTAPTIGTPINCGTTPAAAVTAGSTDTAGAFTITTGTGGTSSTCDTVITFRRTYGAAPKTILVTGKTDIASVARQIYVVSTTATTFTVAFATSAGGANSTAYNFSYWVIE